MGGNNDGAIFLRADRMQSFGQKTVEAFGKVELRAKGQTVLADHLMYDIDDLTLTADGDVTLREGLDWVTGPKLVFQRETWWNRVLHNETAFAIQRRLQWLGRPMLVMPVRVGE